MLENILIICLFAVSFVVFFLTYKLYQFSMLILKIEDSIEDCIDILNERYLSVSKVLEREVFFDSIEVRQVIADLKASQNAIYAVANTLTQNMENPKNDNDNSQNQEN